MLEILFVATHNPPWGPGPPPETTDGFFAWLFHWQTLIAGVLSALAVALVAAGVAAYEVFHQWLQANRATKRLARALSFEIDTIVGRVRDARISFDICARTQSPCPMPEIARPFPVYSSHTRDLALFDETTGKHVMIFYEALSAYGELREYFRDKPINLKRLHSDAVPPLQEQAFVRLSNRSLALADQLQARLGAIETGLKPPDWSDDWVKDKPYEPI
jgi:hypothetical protein